MVLSEFDKTFDYSETDIVPCRGDFSFLSNSFFKESLMFDLIIFKRYNLYYYLSFELEFFKIFLHPYHTTSTFERNVKCIKFIKMFGWTEFVIKIFNSK